MLVYTVKIFLVLPLWLVRPATLISQLIGVPFICTTTRLVHIHLVIRWVIAQFATLQLVYVSREGQT